MSDGNMNMKVFINCVFSCSDGVSIESRDRLGGSSSVYRSVFSRKSKINVSDV